MNIRKFFGFVLLRLYKIKKKNLKHCIVPEFRFLCCLILTSKVKNSKAYKFAKLYESE